MKWLLLSLLSINLILFLVHYKENGRSPEYFQKKEGAKSVQLLAEDSVGSEVAEDRCFVIEGIELAEFMRVKDYLGAQGINVEQIDRHDELAPSYWVYVMQGEGVKMTQEALKAQGVDSFEIMEGELKGMLSVGLFENIDLARALVKKLKDKGVAVDLFERKKIIKTSILEIKAKQIKDKDGLLKGLQESKINVGQIKEFFCKSVASEK